VKEERMKESVEEEMERGVRKYYRKLKSLYKTIDRSTHGIFGYIFYAFLGVMIAFLMNQSLAFALTTDLPVVAVVSQSMLHDSTIETTHYQWLEKNFGYERSYIESWPIENGFDVGDMPIVQGAGDYNIGDVIVYSIPNQKVPIIHRIITKNDDGSFVTKGDHNSNLLPFESSVKKSQIHGKVIFIIPKLGYFKVGVSRLMGV